jgi:Patatin-like phospholipase
MADTLDRSIPLEGVLEVERMEIDEIRWRRSRSAAAFDKGEPREAAEAPAAGKQADAADAATWQGRDQNWVETVSKAHAANLVGLAFSGGGIRSATFNLGVLQALADLKLLHRIDYLSTVSGGGYIGGWLVAWSKRLKSFAEVQKRLATNRVHQPEDNEPTPIRFLRVFSNYLTPKLGIFSGDTWAMVGIYVRNMLLNQTVVLAVLAAVLLMPRAAEKWVLAVENLHGHRHIWLGSAIGLLLIAFLTILNNMEYLDRRDAGGVRQITKQGWVLLLAGAPLFATAALGAVWRHMVSVREGHRAMHFEYGKAAAVGAAVYGGIWLVATLVGLFYRTFLAGWVSRIGADFAALEGKKRKMQGEEGPLVNTAAPVPSSAGMGTQIAEFVAPLLGAMGAGALAGWLYALLSEHTLYWDAEMTLTAGVPLVLGIFLLAGTLHLGLMGTVFPDRGREWWGRLGGWLLLWGLAWVAIFWVALYFPDFIENNAFVKSLAAKYLTPTWIVTTVGGVLAGKSSTTGKLEAQTWKDYLAKVAPYVFVAGLMCWISWVIQQVQKQNLFADCAVKPLAVTCSGYFAWVLVWIAQNRLWAAIAGCVAVAVIMAWRVDVNQFSMHLFYRNRLVRCYLGASNDGRSPNRFTGFDRTDDVALKDFSVLADPQYDGPYPVLNASLNLVKGKDLAWQERKAESFVMTPRFCGYDVWLEEQDSPMMRGERPKTAEELKNREDKEKQSMLRGWLRRLDRYGYRQTEQYAFPPPLFGPFLGLAMGISGAAASPNMGFYTTMPVAFLMTVFNVRLGQWLGNPRDRKTWQRPTPVLGLPYLVNELLGGTDDEAAYVYLSDGGHFENMGLYELVKRRCGLIILCDAEADGDYCFGGLGNAIRKCRIDLGIDIVLDVTDIKPKKAGAPSKKHFAVGTIHYENVDLNAPTGTIVYFKASLTGDESTDVKNYGKTHNTFPHETTADQWFTESQFESYRQLGYHEVITSIRSAKATAQAPQIVEQPVSKGLKAAAAKLATAAVSSLRAAAEAMAADVPDAKREESLGKAKAPDELLREAFESFGFDTSEFKDAAKRNA